jgi:hypothetical protein
MLEEGMLTQQQLGIMALPLYLPREDELEKVSGFDCAGFLVVLASFRLHSSILGCTQAS